MNKAALAVVSTLAIMAAHAQTRPGFQAELLDDFAVTSQHLIQLADGIPADKYNWRPAAGVRSVSEVLVHIAAGNYLMLGVSGAKPPAEYFPNSQSTVKAEAMVGRMRELEKTVTRKDQVERMLKDSLDRFHEVFSNLTAAELDRSVDWFGDKDTVRRMCLRLFAHDNEHYGQLIAYARMMGVVPPWSK